MKKKFKNFLLVSVFACVNSVNANFGFKEEESYVHQVKEEKGFYFSRHSSPVLQTQIIRMLVHEKDCQYVVINQQSSGSACRASLTLSDIARLKSSSDKNNIHIFTEKGRMKFVYSTNNKEEAYRVYKDIVDMLYKPKFLNCSKYSSYYSDELEYVVERIWDNGSYANISKKALEEQIEQKIEEMAQDFAEKGTVEPVIVGSCDYQLKISLKKIEKNK